MPKFKKKTYSNILGVSVALGSLGFIVGNVVSSHGNKIVNNTKNNFVAKQKLNSAETQATNNQFDYIPIADNKYSAPISTESGYIGYSNDQRQLIMTAYEGVEIWRLNLDTNSDFNSFYNAQYPGVDTKSVKIVSWKYLEESNLIVILTSDTTDNAYKNGLVFAVDASTGLVFSPIRNANNVVDPLSNSTKVADGVTVLYKNSNNDIIATVDGQMNTNNDFPTLKIKKAGYSEVTSKITINSTYGISSFSGIGSHALGVQDGKIRANDWILTALVEGKKGSNANFVLLTAPTGEETTADNHKDGFKQKVVVVDDNLKPIINTSGQPVSINTKYGMALFSDVSKDLNAVPKYGFYANNDNANISSSVFVIAGRCNAVYKFDYDSSNKKISINKFLDMQDKSKKLDQDVSSFYYDDVTQRVITSNIWSSSNASVGYTDLSESELKYYTIIAGDGESKPISNVKTFSPVFSKNKINESPIIIYDSNDKSKTIGYYYKNGNFNNQVNLPYRNYNDINAEIKSQDFYKNAAPSSVKTEQLNTLLKISGNPNKGAWYVSSTTESDDKNGILTVNYQVKYQKWWTDVSNDFASFNIKTIVDGMYKKEGIFHLVTEKTNDSVNNIKYDKINEFKSIKYPSDITNLEIINDFVVINMKDKNGNNIKLQESDVQKVVDDENGTLKVTVDISKYLPTGFETDYYKKTFTYDGFLSSKGYEVTINNDATLKENGFLNQYPSQVTLSDIFDKLVVLGHKFPTSPTEWDFEVTPNDIDGSLTVSLLSKNQFVPSNKRKILENKKIDGFKAVGNDFKNVAVNSYNGLLTSQQIWDEYNDAVTSNKNVLNTTLASLISVPYLSFDQLNISLDENNSKITSNSLPLKIEIKPNSVSQLFIGTEAFVWTQQNINDFSKSELLQYPFKTSVAINTAVQDFTWNKPTDYHGNSVEIDTSAKEVKINLENVRYENINKEMFADDITKETVVQDLFSASYYDVNNIVLSPNRSAGTLVVTIYATSGNSRSRVLNSSQVLNSAVNSQEQVVPEGGQVYKRIELTGFKIPLSPYAIWVPVIAGLGIIAAGVVFLVYTKVIKRNLRKTVTNSHDIEYLNKLKNNNQKRLEMLKEKRHDEVVKYVEKNNSK